MTGTVNKFIPAVTQRMREKLPGLKENPLTPVMIASLTLLLNDQDTFSAAALAKLNPGMGEAMMNEGADGIANIHNAIQDVILFHTAETARKFQLLRVFTLN